MTFFPAARIFRYVPALVAAVFLPGCAVLEGLKSGRPDPQVVRAKEKHAAFRAESGWRKKIYRDDDLIRKAAEGNTSVEIALREQRGLLLVDHAIAMDFPVATGRATHPTPKGSYKILEKKKEYSSNLYGRIVGADGSTVVPDADTRDHVVPAGGSFVGAPMPYWMRMTPTGLGMHVGHVPGHRPASHGCIRLKRETATELFAMLAVGTPVKVESFAPALGGPVGVDSVVIGEAPDKPPRSNSPVQPKPAPEGAPVPAPTPAPAANDVTPTTGVVVEQPVPPASPAPTPEPALVPEAVLESVQLPAPTAASPVPSPAAQP